MAKTYNLEERATGLGNVTAVAVAKTKAGAAGALAIGTFYYKQLADGYSDFYDDLNAWVSVPSAEVSVTTDASNKVVWIHHDDDIAHREDTITIRTDISGDYNQTDSSGNLVRHFPRVTGYRSNHYMGVRTDNNTIYNRYTMTTSAMTLTEGEKLTGQTSGATALVVSNPAGGTTFKVWTITGTFSAGETIDGDISGVGVGTFTSISAKDGIVIEDSSSSALFAFPVFDGGLPCLQAESDDTADPVTPQDVYEWFIDQGKPQYCDGVSLFQDDDYMTTNGKNLCNFFRWRFSIYTRNFKIPGGTVISQALAKHMFRNGEFTMGEIGTEGQTTNGAGIIGAWHLAYYNTLARAAGSNINIYGSMVGMPTETQSSCNRDPYYQITYQANIKDSVVRSSGRWNPPLNLNNTRMMVSGEIGLSKDSNTNVTNNVTWNSQMGGSYSHTEVTFKDSNIVPKINYTFYVDSYYLSTGCRVINNYNMTYDSSLYAYYARFRSNIAIGSDNMIRNSNSIKIKVVDKNGDPIVGAKMYATDKDGYKGLFDADWVTRTYTNLGKTGTAMTLYSTGDVTVGKYYRSGDETILIVSGSNPNYTIVRGQLGSTANNIGGSSSGRMSYLYELQDYLETDVDGETEAMLNHSYYKSLDNPIQYHYIQESDLLLRSPYDIIIKADGYETYTMKYVAEEQKDMVIELKDTVSVMTSTDSKVAVKLDPTNSGVNRDKLIIM